MDRFLITACTESHPSPAERVQRGNSCGVHNKQVCSDTASSRFTVIHKLVSEQKYSQSVTNGLKVAAARLGRTLTMSYTLRMTGSLAMV